MASIKHATQASGTNNPDKQVSVNAWNESHVLTGSANHVLGFDADGNATELDPSTFGTPYSDENARDAIGAALVGGAGNTVVIDDAGNTITVNWDGGEVNVGTPADGDVLTWDDAASRWVSGPALGGGGTVPDGGTTGQVLTKDSNIDQDVSWQDSPFATGAAPAIRGSNIGTTTGTTVAITLPAGSAAGDTAIIIAISGNPVYPPSGTELIDEVSDSSSNFAVYTRVLDASDITTGSLTVTTATAFFMVATIVVIQGAVGHVEMNKRLMQIGAKPTPFQNRKIRSNLFFANDLCLLSLSCRGSASTNTSDLGTLQQTSANSNGSQAVYSIPIASKGAIVPTVNIPNTGSFDMRVMFITVRGV